MSRGPLLLSKSILQRRRKPNPTQSLEVQKPPNPDLEAAFHAATKERVNALVTILNPVLSGYKLLTELAIKDRLPSIYEATEYVEAGGLMSYATNEADSFRRAAYYVDTILREPSPLIFLSSSQQKLELVINLKTAKQIRLTIPPVGLVPGE